MQAWSERISPKKHAEDVGDDTLNGLSFPASG